MKNKIDRTLLVFLVFTLGESIFAEAKPLPDFNVEKVNWGTQRYKFTLIKNEEKIEWGSVTLRNKLAKDRVILTDEFLLRIEGKPISLNMTQVCLKDQYLSPVKIECKGKGDEEFPTFKATIKDGQAKIDLPPTGPRDGMMEIPKGTVTSAAFMRIVTQLPRVEGATYRYDFALEASEMNLKKEYLVKVIGKETIDSNGPVKCWKISQNGGGIGEQLYWVTDDGILQRILMDGRKQIDLQTVESGD
jgi:hypothetical protein